jgi:hypothetical protein
MAVQLMFSSIKIQNMKPPAHCKYTPLENHLRILSATESVLTIFFEQIEMAMQSKLPKSAYLRLSWWDNAVHSTISHKHAWLHAGWQVEQVDLSGKWVRFVRTLQNEEGDQ